MLKDIFFVGGCAFVQVSGPFGGLDRGGIFNNSGRQEIVENPAGAYRQVFDAAPRSGEVHFNSHAAGADPGGASGKQKRNDDDGYGERNPFAQVKSFNLHLFPLLFFAQGRRAV